MNSHQAWFPVMPSCARGLFIATPLAIAAIGLIAGTVLLVGGQFLLAGVSEPPNYSAVYQQQSSAEPKDKEILELKREVENQRALARFNAYVLGMNLAQRAWEEGDVGRTRELLEEVPKDAGGRDLRGFEWRYLSRLCQPNALTLKSHRIIVHSIAFSPDGKRLASAGDGGVIRVWDAATGKELLSIKGHAYASRQPGAKGQPASVNSVMFTPDGQRLISASDDMTVKVWDSASGKNLKILEGHGQPVWWATIRPDGQRLASCGQDGTIKIWDLPTGKVLVSLTDYVSVYGNLAYSQDGKRLAYATRDNTVKVWDTPTGKGPFVLKSRLLKGHTQPTTGVAFSPDGLRLASAGRDAVRIWEVATGKELLSLKGHPLPTGSVAFSPDGRRLASGSRDETVKVWDATTGNELFTLKDLEGKIVFSPDGQQVAACKGGSVKVCEVRDGEQFSIPCGTKPVYRIAYSPDGKHLASASMDQTVRVWEAATGTEVQLIKGPALGISGIAFSPDGQQLAAGCSDKTIKIWNAATGEESQTLQDSANIMCVAYSPDGKRLVSGGMDGKVKAWELATGQEAFARRGHSWFVNSVAFSPDGKRLASAGFSGNVKLWDSATGKELFNCKGHTGMVHCIAYSPDGRRLVSAGDDMIVRVWDTQTGKECLTAKGHTNGISCVAYSPDGQRLATAGSDQTVKLWDASTGKELVSFKARGGLVHWVAFSPDGQHLASGNADGTIRIWEDVSPSPADQLSRTANQIVREGFARLYLRPDVLDYLQKDALVPGPMRQRALAIGKSFPEDASYLNQSAWDLAKEPGKEASAYDLALRLSKRACEIETENSGHLTTLGMVYYRLGKYQDSLDALAQSKNLDSSAMSRGGLVGWHPGAQRAFLAMSNFRLGNSVAADENFKWLRSVLNSPSYASHADSQSFLREAEALFKNGEPAKK